VAALLSPIAVAWHEVAVALVMGLVSVACTIPSGRGFINRRRGVVLLALYAVYLVALLQWQAT
jgi:cation:H+ antiporter